MGLFTIDRTINFDESKVKRVLKIIESSSTDEEIEDKMVAQQIVNLRVGTEPHGFFRRRWNTFLKDFELYNYPYLTEMGKLYMNDLLTTKEITLLLLLKRCVSINGNTVRPFELILKVLEKLHTDGSNAYITQEEFEKVLSHYGLEGYKTVDEIVHMILRRRYSDPVYVDVEATEPCHYDIWKNLIITSGLAVSATKNIEIDVTKPIVKFISKYFDETPPANKFNYDFNDSFIRYIPFPTLVDENGDLKFVRTNYKNYYPSIIYNYLFVMSINKIETEILKTDEHGNIPHKILNGINISTNMNDEIRNIRLYECFQGYEGIIVNKLRNSNSKTYKYIADGISTYLLTSNILEEDGDESEQELEEEFDSYTKEDFLKEVYMDESTYDSMVSILEKKKNIILEGAPGVGKSFMAKRLAYSILGSKNENRIKFIQFHQSYSYEEFVEGYRPTDGGFELKKGIFYNACKKAEELKRNGKGNFYIIVDEINRGNLSKIFGELLMLIESDKRGEKLTLAYSDEKFSVPDNLYIIGLMNTADRSLALIDYALRRRFSFFRIVPAFNNGQFKKDFEEKFGHAFDHVIEKIKKMNDAIEKDPSLGPGFAIGHSYFCPNLGDRKGNQKDINEIITYEIIPLIEEYWFDDEDSLKRWKKTLNGVIND